MRSKILDYKDYKIKIGDNEVAQRVILLTEMTLIKRGGVKGHLRTIAKEINISIVNKNRKNPILTTQELGKKIYDKLKQQFNFPSYL